MANLQKLQAEIIGDPDERGYAVMSDVDVLTRIKRRRFADVHIIRATEVLPVPYSILPADVKTIVDRALANKGHIPSERKAMRRKLAKYFGGVDRSAANNDIVLIRQFTSIAEETGIGFDVSIADIQAVRAL